MREQLRDRYAGAGEGWQETLDRIIDREFPLLGKLEYRGCCQGLCDGRGVELSMRCDWRSGPRVPDTETACVDGRAVLNYSDREACNPETRNDLLERVVEGCRRGICSCRV